MLNDKGNCFPAQPASGRINSKKIQIPQLRFFRLFSVHHHSPIFQSQQTSLHQGLFLDDLQPLLQIWKPKFDDGNGNGHTGKHNARRWFWVRFLGCRCGICKCNRKNNEQGRQAFIHFRKPFELN